MRLRRRGAVAAIVLTAIVAMEAAATTVGQSPSTGPRIVFQSSGRIFSIAADGGDRELLSSGANLERGGDRGPAWSPDGTAIAFVRGGSDDARVFVMDADGSDQRPLTTRAETIGDPQWSPDGKYLVFDRIEAGSETFRSELVTVPAAGGPEVTVITRRLSERTPAIIGEPSFVPGTTRISYTSSEFTREGEIVSSLRTVESDGSGDRLLRNEASSAAWSPDGSRVAFSGLQDRNGEQCGSDFCSPSGEIYVMDADGDHLDRLTSNRGADELPDWSADGSHIVFSSDRNYPDGQSAEIYSIGADGSCLSWLTNGSPESADGDIQPAAPAVVPSGCGGRRRPALVELPSERPDAGAPAAYWLGERSGPMLISRIDAYRGTTELGYDDCAQYDPSDCGPSLLLVDQGVCSSGAMIGHRALPSHYEMHHGVLLTETHRHVVAYAGATEVQLFAGRSPVADQLRLLAGLRPLGDEDRPRKPPAPRLPAALLARARHAAAVLRELGSVRQTAAALDVRTGAVKGLVRLAGAADRFGDLAGKRCRRHQGGRRG